jgi:hypothetical protein
MASKICSAMLLFGASMESAASDPTAQSAPASQHWLGSGGLSMQSACLAPMQVNVIPLSGRVQSMAAQAAMRAAERYRGGHCRHGAGRLARVRRRLSPNIENNAIGRTYRSLTSTIRGTDTKIRRLERWRHRQPNPVSVCLIGCPYCGKITTDTIVQLLCFPAPAVVRLPHPNWWAGHFTRPTANQSRGQR